MARPPRTVGYRQEGNIGVLWQAREAENFDNRATSWKHGVIQVVTFICLLQSHSLNNNLVQRLLQQ